MKHSLSNIDSVERTATCQVCGPVRVYRKGVQNGVVRFRCAELDDSRTRTTPWSRIRERWLKDSCERCGFIPGDECQLDIHHVDFNRNNNDPENFETLCANCHRIVTKEFYSKQGKRRNRRTLRKP